MNINTEPQVIKIVVIGDGAVGKTSLLLTYTQDRFPVEYIPTVFENYSSIMKIDDTQIQLSLWDTAGQESYNRLRVLSYQAASAFILVFSAIDQQSFQNIWDKWIPELNQEGKGLIPKIVVANKCDLIKDKQQLLNYWEKCEQEDVTYRECSAFLNNGIKELFDEIIRMARKNEQLKSVFRSKRKPTQKTFCQLL